jgi:hypothetical protein
MNTVKWIVIIVVAALVVGAAAGFGGYSMGKSAGTAQALAARQNFFAARGGGQGGAAGTGNAAGGNGQAGGLGRGNFGQIKQISGDTIDLSTATAVLKVKVTSQTQIEKQAQGTISDLQTGERITVSGSTGSDGVLTATRIQLLPANAGGPGGQQQAGAGAQQQTGNTGNP